MEKLIRRGRSVVICFATILITSIITLSSGIFDKIVTAAGDKALITKEMLASYFEEKQKSGSIISVILIIVVAAVFAAGIIGFYRTFRSDIRSSKSVFIAFVICSVLLPVAAVSGVSIAFVSCDVGPSYKSATYDLVLETAVRTEKEEYETIDSDGGHTKSYRYYVYVADDRYDSGERRINIDATMYRLITEPGDYYFARATDEQGSDFFYVYPASCYEPSPELEVN